MNLFDQLDTTENQALEEISRATGPEILQQLETNYLSRKGILRGFFGQMAALPDEQKPQAGEAINRLKKVIEEKITEQRKILAAAPQTRLPEGFFDISLPGFEKVTGSFHPVYRTMQELSAIFVRLGFNIAYGPEIETEFYNFTALNIPLDHPSRDAFDTFYLSDSSVSNTGRLLLRSHTSPVQVRIMEKTKPPLQVIVPGKVFRPDTPGPSRFPMFHQIEGLMVDENVSFANLKGILSLFIREFFGSETRMRFRPSFFPFTEPSAEVDISCVICGGTGDRCPVCRGEGWLEILGAGMVHPKVFEEVNYDSEKYTGFAFGLGVERMAMLKYSINDIRLFTENHLKFLEQF